MVYEGAGVISNQTPRSCLLLPFFQSLDYVNNYAEATSQWEGFPIMVGYFFFESLHHRHAGKRASQQHLGRLQGFGFRRRHQHPGGGGGRPGSAGDHGLVLQRPEWFPVRGWLGLQRQVIQYLFVNRSLFSEESQEAFRKALISITSRRWTNSHLVYLFGEHDHISDLIVVINPKLQFRKRYKKCYTFVANGK